MNSSSSNRAPPHQQKAKLCFDELEHMAKTALEQRRQLHKERALNEQLQDRVSSLQTGATTDQTPTSSTELSSILDAANCLVQLRALQTAHGERERQLSQMQLQLDASLEEADRVRARYRDAIVTSTRGQVQMGQLGEELEASKHMLAGAETRAQRDANRAQLFMQERDQASRRAEQLAQQLHQLKAQLAATELKLSSAAGAAQPASKQPRVFGMERDFAQARGAVGVGGGEAQKQRRSSSSSSSSAAAATSTSAKRPSVMRGGAVGAAPVRVGRAWSGVMFLLLMGIVLVVLPFVHHYLALAANQAHNHNSNPLTRDAARAVDSLRDLHKTATMYDQFVEQRKRRRESSSNQAPISSRRRSPPPPLQPVIDDDDAEEGNGNVLSRYLAANHGVLPVLVVCHDRPEELGETLDSLQALRPHPPPILVAQDGDNADVFAQASKRGTTVQVVQNTHKTYSGIMDGGKLIARHYGFALQHAFDVAFPDAPAVIVLEDDLKASPDFMDWFVHAGLAIEADKSLWCASAWNDNGFADNTDPVLDRYTARRTALFPGLGWLLLRSEYHAHLRRDWPVDQWDWYVRRIFQRADRECLFPEIPRVRHIRRGGRGTFVSSQDQRDIFDRMTSSSDSSSDGEGWRRAALPVEMKRDRYDAKLAELIQSAVHVGETQDFASALALGKATNRAVAVWYRHDPAPQFEPEVKPLCRFFGGIWHQLLRSSHEGVLHVRHRGAHPVLLINTFDPVGHYTPSLWFTSYHHQSRFASSLLPAARGARVFTPREFLAEAAPPARLVAAAVPGQDCHQVCLSQHATGCSEIHLAALANTCDALQAHFPCTRCESSEGVDQPCMVQPDAPLDKLPGVCLVRGGGSTAAAVAATPTCAGQHALTRRLCACEEKM